MSKRCRAQNKIVVGSRAKVCIDNKVTLIMDMGLVDSNDKPIEDTWMYGKVSKVHKFYYEVDLPAAEESLNFPKELVLSVKEGDTCPDMYVVFGKL